MHWNLQTFLTLKNWSQADLAKKTGLSRQVISSWLNSSKMKVNPSAQSLIKITNALGIKVDDLFIEIPVIHNRSLKKDTETQLLWDKLYPDLESFASAIARGKPDALARLVQVYGIFEAAKIAGVRVWKKFDQYKNKIAPAYRKQAQVLWNLYQAQH